MTKNVYQSSSSECMLACFTMIANHYGDQRTLREFRGLYPELTNGASLRDFTNLCNENELAARPVKVEVQQIRQLSLPALLHWNQTHFVVLKKVNKRNITVLDPAAGEIKYTFDEFSEFFTGVASEVTPQAQFIAKKGTPPIRLREIVKLSDIVKKTLQYSVLVGLLLQIFLALSPLAMQTIVDSVVANSDLDLLPIIVAAFFLVSVISGALEYCRDMAGQSVLSGVRYALNMRLVKTLLETKWSFFNHRRVAIILSYFKSFEFFSNFIAFGIVIPTIDFIAVIVLTLIMISYSPSLAAVVFIVTATVTLLRLLMAPHSRKLQQNVVQTSASNEAFVFETLSGIQTLKNNGNESGRLRMYAPRLQEFIDAAFRTAKFESGFSLFVKLLRSIEYAIVIYLLTRSVLDQTITLGMMYAFTIYRNMIEARFESVLSGVSMYLNLPAHLEQVEDIVVAPRELDAGKLRRQVLLSGDINVSSLSVTLQGANKPVISNFSEHIKEGEFVAIVGASGAGKTTLINTLLGLIEQDKGEITIDGIDVSVDKKSIFKNSCGVVMQSDALFTGSILDNITMFNEIPDVDRAIHSCKCASFSDELEGLKLGINTNVGDMGGALSSGQRQRVLLARAFYRRPSFFVLDEATANMDEENEEIVLTSLKETGCTVLFATHSKRVMEAADRIVHVG